MGESRELFNEVAQLRDQVDDMNRSVSALTRQSGLFEKILEAMGKDEILANIFLQVDGTRTQQGIISAMADAGLPAVSQATVSRKIELLVQDWDLVRPTNRSPTGIIYVHTSLARALKVKRALAKGQHKPKRPGASKGK